MCRFEVKLLTLPFDQGLVVFAACKSRVVFPLRTAHEQMTRSMKNSTRLALLFQELLTGLTCRTLGSTVHMSIEWRFISNTGT